MHIPEGGKMQISPKLEVYRVNQDQIRNQRPRLRRNTLILGRKAGGFSPEVPKCQAMPMIIVLRKWILSYPYAKISCRIFLKYESILINKLSVIL